MKRNFKIVKPDKNNSDEYLVGFYDTEMEAHSALFEIPKKYPTWIKSHRELLVKRVDPELIPRPVATDYEHYLRSLIPDEEWLRVIKSDASAEIDCNNMTCGRGTYYMLSKMIPKDWTVIDVGASYGAQSYLFQGHAKYIAVDPFESSDNQHFENFKADGTERYEMTAGKFIKDVLPTLNLDLKKTFAIANYTPSWFGESPIELVRTTFYNVWTFYPCS